jgi:hypothetical protein
MDVVAADTSYGLPPSGLELVGMRDKSTAVAIGDGDTVTVVRRLRI